MHTLIERARFRITALRLGWTMKPIAGADTPPADPPEPTPSPQPPSDPPAPDPAPPAASGAEARIRQLNEEKKAADDRAAAAEKALSDREKADMSEKERAERERDEAQKERDEANAKATRLERSAWARTAAREKNFIDPDDAVAHLDLASLDTETKVTNAVEKLAESKKHLVSERPTGGFGTPGGSAGTSPAGVPEVAVGADGNPDAEDAERLQAGRDLMGHMRR